MTDRDRYLDARLSELMSDAVSEIEPGDRLASIRNETRVTSMSARRPWIYAVGGAVAATAAVITAVAFAGDNLGLTGSEPDPATSPSSVVTPSGSDGTPDASETPSSTPSVSDITVAAYYVGDGPRGPRLFREFDVVSAEDQLAGALARLQATPADPDYRTPWPQGTFSGASFAGDLVTVNLTDASLHDRPAGMSSDEAEIAIQQVVYTMQAAVQARAAVEFKLDGNPVDQVLGVPTSEPLAEDPQTDVLSLMSITSPSEGESVSGSLTADGVGSSFEANVQWQIKQGDEVVKSGSTTAEGWMDKLYPWQTEAIDVSDLTPGDYTFVAMTDDPSGGAEGNGPDVDTRTITVR
jgi:hypothetical protein